jgi:hypothetical protein
MRSKVIRLTAVARRLVSREPGRPPSANATAHRTRCRTEVRRACRGASPGSGSAKVRRAHPLSSQNSWRTRTRRSTSRASIGASDNRRTYRLCTRPDCVPHPGQATGPGRVLASNRTTISPARTPSMHRPARCGNSTPGRSRSEHRSRDQLREAGAPGRDDHANRARSSLQRSSTAGAGRWVDGSHRALHLVGGRQNRVHTSMRSDRVTPAADLPTARPATGA